MIEGKSVIAMIPARAGSKGLPGKNIRLLCGKPLIAWTVEKALKSQYLDEIMVSTDGEEIARVAAEYGAKVPFLRPADLATDTSTTLSAVRHALDHYSDQHSRRFDLVVLLEPTSPLREDGDIDGMLEKLIKEWQTYDSIVSMGEVREHPSIMKRIHGDDIGPFCPELVQTSRRQDNAPAYFPYGVAYITKTHSLLEEQTFYTARCTYYLIKRYQNYEIDDLHDFICVETVMRQEWRLS
jgi:CMP-N,N'-diacetyllegionaminic acid synthase